MRRLVLAEGDRCDDGGRVQLQRDVLGRVVGVGGPAGRLVGRLVVQNVVRLRSWRSSISCSPASSDAPPAAAAEARLGLGHG